MYAVKEMYYVTINNRTENGGMHYIQKKKYHLIVKEKEKATLFTKHQALSVIEEFTGTLPPGVDIKKELCT